jgi:hypothetical protein
MDELIWFERMAQVTYLARIGVEARTLEEADAKFEAHDYTDFDTVETIDFGYTTKTKEIG